MTRQGGVGLAAGSPLGTAAAMSSQSLHASQLLSFDVAVIGGSTTGVFAAVRAAEKGMIRFLNLDGTENLMHVDDAGIVQWTNSRWRAEGTPSPACYSIPYRAIVPVGSENVLCAGRMLDCSRDAYGALRVMVNCNQMGEAAGLAAAKAVKSGLPAFKAYAGMPNS